MLPGEITLDDLRSAFRPSSDAPNDIDRNDCDIRDDNNGGNEFAEFARAPRALKVFAAIENGGRI